MKHNLTVVLVGGHRDFTVYKFNMDIEGKPVRKIKQTKKKKLNNKLVSLSSDKTICFWLV